MKPSQENHVDDGQHNVKDFGALGIGTDDSDAIQAAIDWQTADGNRGVIFFPSGTYVITKPLTFDYVGPHSIIFRGVGRGSKLTGNFSGFILDRSLTGNGDPGIDIIENLWFENSSTNAAAGCIRWNSCGALTVRSCLINGHTGFVTTDSLFDLLISQVHMSSNGSGSVLPQSVGLLVENLGGAGKIEASSIIGYGDGVRLGGTCQVTACRFELCGNGINVGTNVAGGGVGAGNVVVIGCGFEACDVGIWARNAHKSLFMNCEVNGHAAAYYSGYGAGGSGPLSGTDADNDKWSTYGFVTGNGTKNLWINCNVLGDTSTISYNGAAILIAEDYGSYQGTAPANTWINCHAANGGVSFSGSTTIWNISGMDNLCFERCTPDPLKD